MVSTLMRTATEDGHGLGGGRPAVDADEAADGGAGREGPGNETLLRVLALEQVELGRLLDEALAAGFGFLGGAAELDVVLQLFDPKILTNLSTCLAGALELCKYWTRLPTVK